MRRRAKERRVWENASKIFFSSFFRGKITKIFSISDLLLEAYLENQNLEKIQKVAIVIYQE